VKFIFSLSLFCFFCYLIFKKVFETSEILKELKKNFIFFGFTELKKERDKTLY